MSLPQLQEALKLEADAEIDLWEIRLRGPNVRYRFWNGPERTWQGNIYNGHACQLTGEGSGTEGQANRPTLTVVNPENIFGVMVAEGYFDLAEVIRRRVLQQHFINNVNIFDQKVWLVGRVSLVRNPVLQLELRSTTDMPAWKTPRRTFSPPDFPFVVL